MVLKLNLLLSLMLCIMLGHGVMVHAQESEPEEVPTTQPAGENPEGETAAEPEPEPELLNLRPMWKQGQRGTYELRFYRDTLITGLGEAMTNKFDINLEVKTQVSKADEAGGGTLKITIGNVKGFVESPEGKATFKNPGDHSTIEGYVKAFKMVRGKTLTLKVASDGRVTNISELSKLLKKGDMPTQGQLVLSLMLQSMLTVDNTPKQAAAGANWSSDFKFSAEDFDYTIDHSHEYLGSEMIEGIEVATIQTQGKFIVKLKGVDSNLKVNVSDTYQESLTLMDMSRHEMTGRHEKLGLTINVSDGTGMQLKVQDQMVIQALRVSESGG